VQNVQLENATAIVLGASPPSQRDRDRLEHGLANQGYYVVSAHGCPHRIGARARMRPAAILVDV